MFKAENDNSYLSSLILSTLVFFIFNINVKSQACIESESGCCDGYFWSYKNNSCESCRPGYNGINCTTSCPYPSYGHQCQGNCDCVEDNCDVSTGCEPNITVCSPGYFGINCTISCTYPLYGQECKGVCNCEEDICNVSTGCELNITACLPGYIGTNCTINCTYPFYGHGCQGVCDCDEDMCDVSTGCEPVTTETFTSRQSPSNSLSETKQILLLLIKLVGCIDIILSSAYVFLCIHGRKRQATETKFSSHPQQSSGRSAAYENIEGVSFLSSR